MLVRVALPVPLHREFDYVAPAGTRALGRCVRVRFGPRKMVGVVVETPATSPVDPAALIAIDGWVDELPDVPPDVLEMARFAAVYYQHPLGIALQHAVPPRGRHGPVRARAHTGGWRLTAAGIAGTGIGGTSSIPRRATRQRELLDRFGPDGSHTVALDDVAAPLRALLKRWLAAGWVEPVSDAQTTSAGILALPPLNTEQRDAVAAITDAIGRFQPMLLQGVTGSGKTEVYLSAAARALDAGRQVLMLVPEINLTPQLAARVRRALPMTQIVELHSHLAAGQRLEAWRQAAAGEAQLVLGTRLAVFAPLPRLGLIVVDEEHDLSYKQQDGLRYSARDLAVYRGSRAQVPVVLGSATPSLETLRQAQSGRYTHLHLRSRAVAGALPVVRIVRQRDPSTIDGISQPLVQGIKERLARGEQTLLFINRRGYAPSLLCMECGWSAQCDRCSARLVFHTDQRRMRCHHCGHEERVVSACPDCGNQDLLPLGHGTQRLEATLRALFPDARIARVDADSTRRKGAWSDVLDDILNRRLDILVGTQMMVKGHDFPHLTLVGVLGADNALYSADFRATERLFAQLIQVSGRAGRAALAGEVIVQTDFGAHSLYRALLSHDYDLHASMLLEERHSLEWPPWTRLALLRAEAKQRDVLERFMSDAHRAAIELVKSTARSRSVSGEGAGDGVVPLAASPVRVSGPVPARLARRAGFERSQILVQADTSRALHDLLTPWREHLDASGARNVRWSLDVDPQALD